MGKNEKKSLPRRIVNKSYWVIHELAMDIYACRNSIEERSRSKKKPKGHKVRVGFIVQYIPAWNKSESLYKLLKSDDRFETFLLCVQNGIKDGKLVDTSCKENDVHEWFIENGYAEAINTYEGDEKWIDLKKLDLDYIFYPRPYNSFMPRQYWSRYVSRYTKICSIMYGTQLTSGTFSIVFNRDFFRNTYLYFAEFKEIKKAYLKKYMIYHKLGMTDSICIGMTFADQILKEEKSTSNSWKFAKGEFRIIWTPRWTTDLNSGGSNFFTYKDTILAFAKDNPSCDILIRPHPLMFDHFIETGELTAEQKRKYECRVERLDNVSFDINKDYVATFWNSNVLVTDISSIIPEYFITGRPIVFCATNFVLRPLEHTKRMLSACYIANSEDDLCNFLTQLKNGIDPLKEKRQLVINDFLNDSKNAEEKIVERLCVI